MSGRPRSLLLADPRVVARAFAPLRRGATVKGRVFERLAWDEVRRRWELVFAGTEGDAPLRLQVEPLRRQGRYVARAAGLGFFHGREQELSGVEALADALARTVARNAAREGEAWQQVLDEIADGVWVAFGDLLEVRLTLACNEDCPMCNSAAGADNLVTSPARLVERLPTLRARGVRALTLTGGEPTLLPELPDLVAAARAQGFAPLVVQTNALRLADPAFRARFAGDARPAYWLVSFHAHQPAVYESIVGRADTFTRAVAGVLGLLADGHTVALNHVLQAENAAQVEGFVDFCVDTFGARVEVAFSVLVPTGRVAGRGDLIPRLSDLAPRLGQAVVRARAAGMPVHLSEMCGLPRCLWPEGLAPLLGAQADLADARVKRKLPGCARCRHEPMCSGVWADYVEAYGDAEFVPTEGEGQA